MEKSDRLFLLGTKIGGPTWVLYASCTAYKNDSQRAPIGCWRP